MIAIRSGANLTLGTRPFLRHARESGHPGATDAAPEAPCSSRGQALGPRFRGCNPIGDDEYGGDFDTRCPRHPGAGGCNPIGLLRERLREIGDFLQLGGKISWNLIVYTYKRLS